jgi:hypothetical protein
MFNDDKSSSEVADFRDCGNLSCLVDGDFDCMGSLSSSHLAGSFESRYSAPHDG